MKSKSLGGACMLYKKHSNPYRALLSFLKWHPGLDGKQVTRQIEMFWAIDNAAKGKGKTPFAVDVRKFLKAA